ncbi:catalase-related domain-containing protein [Clostridium psychrophilum]|uniref:catalase-related domain-containing protein n=1 Tax=Clostridium psychrophilum TaxID=132926 RepID=UPI001FE9E1CE|nr:catalase-related domain-containing protein [Clostridium psychrophilum]
MKDSALIPINGLMQVMPNHGSTNYYPNSLGCVLPKQAPETGISEKPFVKGNVIRKASTYKNNDYAQAGERYCSMNSLEQDNLVSNIVESLSTAIKPIQEKMLVHFLKANKDFGNRIARGLKI